MTLLVKFLLTLVIGTLLGLGLTYYVVRAGVSFDETRAGPWIRWPKAGSMDIDPYAHARLARTAQLPLGTAEGLNFFAWRDSAGEPLNAACDYVVKGPVPPTRFWTLTLYSTSGALADNPAKRYGFTSAEILRSSASDTIEIAVSRHARAGNWLPIGNLRAFTLVLRLYDTLFDFGMAKVEAAALPQIAKVHCQ